MTTISPNRARRGARIRILYLAIAVILFLALALLARGMLSGSLWQIMRPLSYAAGPREARRSGIFSLIFHQTRRWLRRTLVCAPLLASSSILAMDRSLLYAQEPSISKAAWGARIPSRRLCSRACFSLLPATPYDTLMLDVGRKSGVSVGDLVAAGGEVIYRRSQRGVCRHLARNALFRARQPIQRAATSQAPRQARSRFRFRARAGGRSRRSCPPALPPQSATRFSSPGLNPKLIANVVAIEGKNEGSFKTLYMHLPVNVYGLRFVEVHRQINPLHAQ